jgi:hypothetical protein
MFRSDGVAGNPSPLKTAGPVPVKIEGESSQAYRRAFTWPGIPLSVTVSLVAAVAFTRVHVPTLPVASVSVVDTSKPYPPRSLIPSPSVPMGSSEIDAIKPHRSHKSESESRRVVDASIGLAKSQHVHLTVSVLPELDAETMRGPEKTNFSP